MPKGNFRNKKNLPVNKLLPAGAIPGAVAWLGKELNKPKKNVVTRKSRIHLSSLESLLDLYRRRRGDIEARLREFRHIWESGSDYELFRELVFCLLTPQSGALRCWQAVCRLEERNLLLKGNFGELREELRTVRFMNNKAQNIIRARELFIGGGRTLREILSSERDDGARREWLQRNVRGLGMKESSHYLRNIGLGARLAILDRHILRRLHAFGVITSMPASLSTPRYREIEGRYLSFADDLAMDQQHLDLLFWLDATGELFK